MTSWSLISVAQSLKRIGHLLVRMAAKTTLTLSNRFVSVHLDQYREPSVLIFVATFSKGPMCLFSSGHLLVIFLVSGIQLSVQLYIDSSIPMWPRKYFLMLVIWTTWHCSLFPRCHDSSSPSLHPSLSTTVLLKWFIFTKRLFQILELLNKWKEREYYWLTTCSRGHHFCPYKIAVHMAKFFSSCSVSRHRGSKGPSGC